MMAKNVGQGSQSDEVSPCVAGSVDNGVVIFEDGVCDPILTEILPDSWAGEAAALDAGGQQGRAAQPHRDRQVRVIGTSFTALQKEWNDTCQTMIAIRRTPR
jgi:hypothetical protein